MGPRGSGKTLYARHSFESMDKKKFSFVNVNITASTKAGDVQDAIEEKLEKRTKELYVPLAGKFQNINNYYSLKG